MCSSFFHLLVQNILFKKSLISHDEVSERSASNFIHLNFPFSSGKLSLGLLISTPQYLTFSLSRQNSFPVQYKWRESRFPTTSTSYLSRSRLVAHPHGRTRPLSDKLNKVLPTIASLSIDPYRNIEWSHRQSRIFDSWHLLVTGVRVCVLLEVTRNQL